MSTCKYVVPETYSNLKVWMALVTKRSLYPCKNDEHIDCEHCKYEQFCVHEGVSYKGVEFIELGPVEWGTLGYRSSPTVVSKESTGAGHLRWRFIKGLPHDGFLLIQKIVRKAGQNMFKIGDRIYYQPTNNYTVEITDSEWHECWPEIGRDYAGVGKWTKRTIKLRKD